MHQVTIDAPRKLIHLTLSGFLTVAEAHELIDGVQAAAASMRWRSDEFVILSTACDKVTQSQEVVTALRERIAATPLRARRVATVREGSLPRMQARRLLTERGDMALFETVAEAEAWLFADEAHAA